MAKWTAEEEREALETLEAFENAGVEVKKYRDTHWSINGIEVFPSTKKYRLNGVVGTYEKLSDLAKINKIFVEP